MNQSKIGSFLKELRNEKGLTQEQLAEKLNVSNRSISRWETGNSLPDISILVELAEFYEIDIKEIIDGERKSEIMNLETKDTLKKVAEYTAEENKKLRNKMADMMAGAAILVIFSSILFSTNAFNGAIPQSSYNNMMNFTFGLTLAVLILNIMYLFGVFERINEKKQAFMNRNKEK